MIQRKIPQHPDRAFIQTAKEAVVEMDPKVQRIPGKRERRERKTHEAGREAGEGRRNPEQREGGST